MELGQVVDTHDLSNVTFPLELTFFDSTAQAGLNFLTPFFGGWDLAASSEMGGQRVIMGVAAAGRRDEKDGRWLVVSCRRDRIRT